MRLLLASRALWRACLTGGTRQAEAEHVSFSGLEVLLPDRVVMREALPAGIHVPFAAMVRSEGEGEEYRLAQLNDLAASVKAQLAQLTAQLKSGLRVKVASETSVMGLKVAAGTQIELIANLGHYSGAPPADVRAPPLAVKIHLHAAIQKLATAVLEVSLQLDAVPECAIALPSLGLRLGQLKVPSLDWSQVEVPRLFESTLGFGVAADWKLVVAEAPTIEAEVEDGTLKSLKIGVPKVEVKYGGQPAGSVVGLSVAYGSTGWKVQAALQPEPVEVEAGKVSLGLLNVAWSRFKVVLSLDVASGTIKALASDIALSISGGGDSTKRVDLIVGIVFDGDRLSLTGLRIERPSPADLTGLLTKVVKGTVDAFVMDIAAGTAVPTSLGLLSPDEVAGLKFMREEEKLAHDVYIAMFASWGHRTFANIAESETTHTEAILTLLTKYGVDDPAAGKAAGVFEDPQLQALYDTLVAAGSVSLIEGLKVGALIEETDIHDIEKRKAITDEGDILSVYGSLLCGSRNHLRAFNQALLDGGVTYVAQVISQQEWDAIAYSAREACSG